MIKEWYHSLIRADHGNRWYQIYISLIHRFYISRIELQFHFNFSISLNTKHIYIKNTKYSFIWMNQNCNFWYQMNIKHRSKLTMVIDDIGFTSIRYIDLTLPVLNFNPFLTGSYRFKRTINIYKILNIHLYSWIWIVIFDMKLISFIDQIWPRY